MDDPPKKTKFFQDEVEAEEGSLFRWAQGRVGSFQNTLHGIEGEADDAVGEGGAVGLGTWYQFSREGNTEGLRRAYTQWPPYGHRLRRRRGWNSRVLRGGSWNNINRDNPASSNRNNNTPDNRNNNNGFRCVVVVGGFLAQAWNSKWPVAQRECPAQPVPRSQTNPRPRAHGQSHLWSSRRALWKDLAWLVIKPEHRRGRYPVRKSMGRETGLATFEEISGI